MLTTDHVRCYRRHDQLFLRALDKKTLLRATEYCEHYIAVLRTSIGKERSEIQNELAEMPVEASDRDLAEGLKKLVLDRGKFEEDALIPPIELRCEVFAKAAAARLEKTFDRNAVLGEVAAQHETTVEIVERLLFADLRDEQRLTHFEDVETDSLLRAYDLGQSQAVLLKAESVTATVSSSNPADYRALFRIMKFQRLMYTAHRESDGYRIEITGPLALFNGTTKYGMAMAICVPYIRSFERWKFAAIVRWGKERRRLRFEQEGARKRAFAEVGSATLGVAELAADPSAELVGKLRAAAPSAVCESTAEIFPVPRLGEFIPDIRFTHEGRHVYIELLGHWSTEAVWKRLDLIRAGLPFPVLLCASSRLRISSDAVPPELPAQLYLYKGVPSARAIAEQCMELLRDT